MVSLPAPVLAPVLVLGVLTALSLRGPTQQGHQAGARRHPAAQPFRLAPRSWSGSWAPGPFWIPPPSKMKLALGQPLFSCEFDSQNLQHSGGLAAPCGCFFSLTTFSLQTMLIDSLSRNREHEHISSFTQTSLPTFEFTCYLLGYVIVIL